ncbi:MAG TPA: hypothetical protein VMB50_07265 [Myxococcales bacterium]|nr:hypothetical protein [Myxococcales bacterium]
MGWEGRLRAVVCLGAFGIVSMAFRAAAQQGPAPGPAQPVPVQGNPAYCPEPAAQSRTLRGHVFQYGTLVDAPMLGTTFGMRFSSTFERVPGFPAGGFGPLDVNQVQASSEADYTQMIIPYRLSLFIQGVGSGVTGSNVSSLLGTGVNYDYDTNLGAQIGLIRDPDRGDLLTLRPEIGYSEGRMLGLGQLVSDLTTNSKATLQDVLADGPGEVLLTPYSTLHFGGSLAYGHAFGSSFALQAALAVVEFDETVQPFQASSNGRVSMVQHDLEPSGASGFTLGGAEGGFPFALQAEYRLTMSWLDSTWQHPEQDADLGLYYSGRPDLQLGVVAIGSWLPALQGVSLTGGSASSSLPESITGEFVFRYVW